MVPRYYECIVCGRRFPHGQGIIMDVAGKILYFHSRRCAYRFMRLVMERADEKCIRGPIDEVLREFNRILEERRVEKVI